MNQKPELLVTAGSLAESKRLLAAGADALLVGERKFGLRLPGDMQIAEIAEAVKAAHAQGAKIYVALNNIMDNVVLDELPSYVGQLKKAKVDAIVFGDPSVLMAVKAEAPEIKLHWNAEMTSTNYVTANYWASKGASRVVLARELNMEQVIEFKQHAKLEVQVQVHGATNIYHSKRGLVQSYNAHQGREADGKGFGSERGMYLIEAERQDERYPIYEDANGTHIMSSDDICMLENLHELMEAGIDSLKIEGLLKSTEYNETVVRAYRKAIDTYAADPSAYEFDEQWLDPIRELQPEGRELSFGFFYKEQVY